MKNFFKLGFTLAEVLVTLAIIGVVASIVMPNLTNGYQYNTLGVRLAKFMSNAQTGARSFAVNNNNILTQQDVLDFANEYFDFKNMADLTADNMGTFQTLRDGTSVSFTMSDEVGDTDRYPIRKYGAAVANIAFQPNVSGLPASIHQTYNFALTETGFIYPAGNDPCNVALYNDMDYKLRSVQFSGEGAANTCIGNANPEGGNGD